jgi:hypothetical protein
MEMVTGATECCYEIDICAKVFQNPSMHDKVTAQTQLCISNYDNVKLQNDSDIDL